MTNIITAPFAWVMRLFYELTGSYGWTLILFTLVVKLILLPFQLKGKKSMVRMGRLSNKQAELQKKYANNELPAPGHPAAPVFHCPPAPAVFPAPGHGCHRADPYAGRERWLCGQRQRRL